MGQIINIGAGEGASTAVQTVSTFAALPSPPAEGVGAERVTADTGVLYIWDGAAWNAAAGGGAVVSVNGQTGTVNLTTTDIPEGTNLYTTYANINTSLGLPANVFLASNASNEVVGYGEWGLNETTKFSNVQLTYQPNNLSAFPTTFSWGVNVDPLQDSPNDGVRLHDFFANLDSAATGFDLGTAGTSLTLLSVGYNLLGNGSVYGGTQYLAMNATIGNGTDPVTVKGHGYAFGFYNVAANATIDGQLQGYGFQPTFNSSAITTSNFSVNAFYDFANLPVAVYGYNGFISNPIIGSIENNHNYNAFSTAPTITTMAGNAGFTAYGCFPTITTLGTGGFNGLFINPTITTQAASSGWSGISIGGTLTTMGATASWQGVNLSPIITTSHGNVTGFNCNTTISGGDADVTMYQGSMTNVSTSSTNLYVLNLNGLTADGVQSSFSADGIRTNLSGILVPLSGQTIQGQHTIFTGFNPTGVGAITGTDILCNIFSPDVSFGNIGDSIAIGPTGLGVNMVAFAGQTHGHGQMDLLNAVTPTAIFQEDFTLGEWRNVNAYVINAGYTGACTKATAFYHEVAGAGLFATTHWGLRVVTPGIENYVESLAVGTATEKVTNASVAIELGGTTRAFVNLNVTTAEKNALTALPGMQVFDTTLSKLSYYDGTVWVNL